MLSFNVFSQRLAVNLPKLCVFFTAEAEKIYCGAKAQRYAKFLSLTLTIETSRLRVLAVKPTKTLRLPISAVFSPRRQRRFTAKARRRRDTPSFFRLHSLSKLRDFASLRLNLPKLCVSPSLRFFHRGGREDLPRRRRDMQSFYRLHSLSKLRAFASLRLNLLKLCASPSLRFFHRGGRKIYREGAEIRQVFSLTLTFETSRLRVLAVKTYQNSASPHLCGFFTAELSKDPAYAAGNERCAKFSN